MAMGYENEEYAQEAGMLSTTTVEQPHELDHLNEQLQSQRKMLALLENKLDPVSQRKPTEEQSDMPGVERIHINNLIGELKRNNRQLDRLINELVL